MRLVNPSEIPKAEEKTKKTSEKIWKIKIKVLTFATAFEKKATQKKKRSLKNLYKQYVVQER